MSPGPSPTHRLRIALATSGLGATFGGIGVVTEMIQRSLSPLGDVQVWRHRHEANRWVRRASWLATVAAGVLRGRDLVLYEHVDLAAAQLLLPTRQRPTYAVFLHGTEVWRPLGRLRREALRRAWRLVANSEWTISKAKEANPWLGDVRCALLGLPESIRIRDRSRPRPPVAVMVGRMHPLERYKGHDQVLEAWPAIRRAVRNAKLVIAGEGADRARLEEKARSMDLSGVEFAGWISNEARDALLGSARVLLFPSRREGFGLVTLEAGAAETPILGLRGTVLEEVFPGERGVALAHSSAPEALAAAAIPLLSNEERARDVGRQARARVEAALLERHFAQRFRAAIDGA